MQYQIVQNLIFFQVPLFRKSEHLQVAPSDPSMSFDATPTPPPPFPSLHMKTIIL